MTWGSHCPNCGHRKCGWSYGEHCEISVKESIWSGARILAPGELDDETLERVAEFTQNEFRRDFESPVGWRGQFVAALRALAGSKNKEGRRE